MSGKTCDYVRKESRHCPATRAEFNENAYRKRPLRTSLGPNDYHAGEDTFLCSFHLHGERYPAPPPVQKESAHWFSTRRRADVRVFE
jgi:hypothetical protein